MSLIMIKVTKKFMTRVYNRLLLSALKVLKLLVLHMDKLAQVKLLP